MLSNAAKIAGLGIIIAIGLGALAIPGHGEITGTDGQKQPRAGGATEMAAPSDPAPKGNKPLQIQCWQHGVKIIDEKDIFSIRLQNLIDRNSLGFKGRGSNASEIYVLPVNDDSTCLIKPLR